MKEIRPLLATAALAAASLLSVSAHATAQTPRVPPAILLAGWNLISAPSGTPLASLQGPLYTLQPNDSAYESIQPSQGATTGYGYWVYVPGNSFLPSPALIPLSAGSATPYSVSAPAGRYILIGNPSGIVGATVTGADAVWVYNALTGYRQAQSLAAGQGALAVSANGGTITVTPDTAILSTILNTPAQATPAPVTP